ncbi:uncharacterized protein K444DRAFT_713022 [Hyaloscypha bicolor E]|uniref:2EXR domain-containing protein n=1 Tax=Hyaloscypha bicolor E TaxID=1095630 RepID=A0A2J6SEZ2_9HELO|nr:uncharacterized protein K444DRAFT_713022 [Hyaloscypha bicolor E]PMD49319.1 hypothetical protein K444DRAFT_713022 [Hyaloscypha bicolor E]
METNSTFSSSSNSKYSSLDSSLESSATIRAMATESTHTVVDNESITEEQSGPVFTLFPKLPPELRNKIWKNACFVTRLIDLWKFPIGEKEFRDACIEEFNKTIWVYKSHSQTPLIMHTPQEARAVGLGYYKLSFGKNFSAKIGQSEVIMSTPARIYLHWEYDVICPMPICLREEGCTIYRGSGPLVRELKDISPLMRRLALGKYDSACIFDLLGSTALEEVMIYNEPFTTLRPFEAHKSISLEFVSIENEVDEKLELGDQERLRPAKRLIQRDIQRRQEGSI